MCKEEPAIRLEDVSKTYISGRTKVQPLRGIHLEIGHGECVGLKGPSGGGKTTLLNLIGTIARPSKGRIFLLGKETTRLPDPFLTRLRREKIGLIFQSYHLIHGYTVLENVTMSLVPTDLTRQEISRRAQRVIEQLGLLPRIDFCVEELSGGEQQRVAVARALMNEPEIILADEPTSNIDDVSGQAVLELLMELKGQGKTIVIASHDSLLLGHPIMDSVYLVKDGVITRC